MPESLPNSAKEPPVFTPPAERSEPKTSAESASSRLPGFYALPISQRAEVAATFARLSHESKAALGHTGAVSAEMVDVFIENGVGAFALPLGVATNFKINGRDYLVPMAVEETSVLAAASHGAKLARQGGGFTTSATPSVMTGQIQLFIHVAHLQTPAALQAWTTTLDQLITARKGELLAFANRVQESLVQRGGGALDLTWRMIPEIESIIFHPDVDTRDAMGANIVNTMCERLSTILAELVPDVSGVGLRILTNLTDKRTAKAECVVPRSAFESQEFRGEEVVDRIVRAYQFAWHDVYRATTNNKGVMNGIDPILIATGNDWRAIEAGAHAYASKDGTYRPLARWSRTLTGDLHGILELPMAVGVVGGVTKLHPQARAALELLGKPSASELAQIVCAVGLAQNLSALRALATEGIQRGHMGLHQKNLDLLDRSKRETRAKH